MSFFDFAGQTLCFGITAVVILFCVVLKLVCIGHCITKHGFLRGIWEAALPELMIFGPLFVFWYAFVRTR